MAFLACLSLLGSLSSSTLLPPPAISWFLSLPPVPTSRQIWGVYAFVMERPGAPPRLYVGSRTAETAGVRSRMLQHLDSISLVPLRVASAKAESFAITNIGLLAWCPTPSPANVPRARAVIMAIEAALTGVLWAIHPTSTGAGFSFPADFCPWSRDQLPWVGLCSHNPLLEALVGDLNLSAAQLKEMAAARRERARTYHQEYRKSVAGTPARQEFIARHNERQKAGTLARQAAAKADKKYHCAPCDVSGRDEAEHRRHLDTPRHAETVARGGKALPWKCVACGKQWKYKNQFVGYCKTKRHDTMVAQFAARLPPSAAAPAVLPSWYGWHLWLYVCTTRLASQACDENQDLWSLDWRTMGLAFNRDLLALRTRSSPLSVS